MNRWTGYRKGLLSIALLAGVSAGMLIFLASTTQAVPEGKITICHADGLAGTIKFSTITIAPSAASNHLDLVTGTPKAGHELDHLGACEEPSPTPTPTPTPTNTPGV
jgi:hypothetical protein